ncbi:MAG: septum site-determining protein MinC [Xylophilus ampelinus]
MAVASAGTVPAFDLKSANLPLIAVVLKTIDPAALAREVERRVRDTPGFFEQDAVVIDLSQLYDRHDGLPATAPDLDIDFPAVMAQLRRLHVMPVAVRGATPRQLRAARAAGLAEATEEPAGRAPAPAAPVVQEIEVVREVPVPGPATMVIDRPLRSGQQVYARGADLIVMAAVNHGAEVIADGNVHVYAPLRGKAVAGARGNTEARIFTTCMQAELVSISGFYRTSEVALPPDIDGKPAKIRLVGQKLLIEAL